MSNATYMAGVVLTVCIVAAIIIAIIAACLSKKVDELRRTVDRLELKVSYHRGRIEGQSDRLNILCLDLDKQVAELNTRISGLHLKLSRVIGIVEGRHGVEVK